MQSNYRQAIFDYICSQAKPPDKLSHQVRLYQLAQELAEEQAFDDDVLFAAAWMHDLGVFIGHRPSNAEELSTWDHIAYALTTVPPLLRSFGFPVEKIPATLEAIRTHLPSGFPSSFEGILLRDADLLEQLGAVGVFRTVSKIGRDTRFITFADALAVLQRNLEQIPALLRLPSARRRAQPRLELLQKFLQAARDEANGAAL